MFSGKIKVFMKKYFFESWGRFWIEILIIWMGISPRKYHQNLIKMCENFIEKIFFRQKFYFLSKHTQIAL